jgi:hypothetical protein
MRLKSKAIACAKRCQSSRLTGCWAREEQSEKMEGQGGGEAQGVADPKKTTTEWSCPSVAYLGSLGT